PTPPSTGRSPAVATAWCGPAATWSRPGAPAKPSLDPCRDPVPARLAAAGQRPARVAPDHVTVAEIVNVGDDVHLAVEVVRPRRQLRLERHGAVLLEAVARSAQRGLRIEPVVEHVHHQLHVALRLELPAGDA